MYLFRCDAKNLQNLTLGFGVGAFIQAIEDDDVRDFMWVNAIVNYFIERARKQRKYLGFKGPRKNDLSLTMALAIRQR